MFVGGEFGTFEIFVQNDRLEILVFIILVHQTLTEHALFAHIVDSSL